MTISAINDVDYGGDKLNGTAWRFVITAVFTVVLSQYREVRARSFNVRNTAKRERTVPHSTTAVLRLQF